METLTVLFPSVLLRHPVAGNSPAFPGRRNIRQRGQEAHRHREAGLPAEEGCPGGGVSQVQPDAVQLQLRQDQGLLHLPWSPGGGGGMPGEPGFQLVDWPGQVHGTIRAQRPPGSGPGAGPTFARLFRAHPAPVGDPGRQWRSRRLDPTREEAGEARVDVLGAISGQLRPALAAQHRLARSPSGSGSERQPMGCSAKGKRKCGPNPVQTVSHGGGLDLDPFDVPG